MNVNNLCYSFIVFTCLLASTLAKSLSQQNNEENEILSRSKRSQPADHSINDKLSRNKAKYARQLHLITLLKGVDTSGRLPAVMMGKSDVPATTTTVLQNLVDPKSGSHARKEKNRKNKRRRKDGSKRSKESRNKRRRRARAVADDIVTLLESEQGEAILRAIVGAIDDDYEHTNDVHDLEKFVRSTSSKCKCSRSRKSKH